MSHNSEELINLFGKLFQQRTFMSAVLRSSRFNEHQDNQRGQTRVLHLLREKDQLTSTEIVEALDIRPSSVSVLVNKLEKAGMIERVPSENDRRVMLISLTEKGKNFIDAAHDLHDEVSADLFDSLSDEEQQELAAILKKLMKDLDDKMPNWPNHDKMHEFMEHYGDFGHDFRNFGFFGGRPRHK